MQIDDTFEHLGYLSTQSAELLGRNQHPANKEYMQQIQGLVAQSITRQKQIAAFDTVPRHKGFLFWIRAVESAQAAVLLADRGMQGSAWASVRTAWECMITACALWRRPEFSKNILEQHIFEMAKQGRELKERASEILDDDLVAEIDEAIEDGKRVSGGWSMFNAAEAAGLIRPYTIYWRGASVLGAHATEPSVSFLQKARDDGSLYINTSPDFDQFTKILDAVHDCLEVGVQRLDEAVQHQFASNPPNHA